MEISGQRVDILRVKFALQRAILTARSEPDNEVLCRLLSQWLSDLHNHRWRARVPHLSIISTLEGYSVTTRIALATVISYVTVFTPEFVAPTKKPITAGGNILTVALGALVLLLIPWVTRFVYTALIRVERYVKDSRDQSRIDAKNNNSSAVVVASLEGPYMTNASVPLRLDVITALNEMRCVVLTLLVPSRANREMGEMWREVIASINDDGEVCADDTWSRGFEQHGSDCKPQDETERENDRFRFAGRASPNAMTASEFAGGGGGGSALVDGTGESRRGRSRSRSTSRQRKRSHSVPRRPFLGLDVVAPEVGARLRRGSDPALRNGRSCVVVRKSDCSTSLGHFGVVAENGGGTSA